MKSPRKPVSQFLLKKSIYTRNHGEKFTVFHGFPLQESSHSQIPSVLLSQFDEILYGGSSQISRERQNSTAYNLDSSNHAKPTSKITCIMLRDPNFSYSVRNLNPVSKRCHFGQIIERRSFSSSASGSDHIPIVSSVNSPFESSARIDAGSSMQKPISLWPGMYHSPVTNALWEARSRIFERVSSGAETSHIAGEFISKTPSSSRTSIFYRFSEDYILREQYRNPWNEIRIGKLLEDLDALAGTISFKHCSVGYSSSRSLILVTASVDKMVLRKPIHVESDVTITGCVTWVGRSSMEIQLEVAQSSEVALTANFTFVARDSETGKSAIIHQISPETEGEILLWKEAEERNKLRKQRKGEEKREINYDEMKRVNELLSEGRVFCDMPALANRDSILMKDTFLQNSLICQPQQRNIHGRIFGGFLMRRAFELAYATAYSFAGTAPCFVEVDHVDFLKPVDVGNFLSFKSRVLFTERENASRPMINVEVVAHVMRPELRSSEVSNNFYFTFTLHLVALKDGLKIRNVVPATEEEARRVIERMDAQKS